MSTEQFEYESNIAPYRDENQLLRIALVKAETALGRIESYNHNYNYASSVSEMQKLARETLAEIRKVIG